VLKLSPRFDLLYRAMPPLARNLTASAYAAWSRRIKYGPGFEKWRSFLAESQWWTPEQVRDYQSQQLRELLQFASERCPFYRAAIERYGVNCRGVDAIAELRKLPVVGRPDVKAHFDEIATGMATDPKLTLSTSGTSGASLHVPMMPETFWREYAFRWQFYSGAGARRGDKFAFFQGHMVVPVQQRKPPFHIRNYTENTLMFSLYHMSEVSLPDYIKAYNAFAPKFIYGYPSGIFVMAAFAQKHRIHLHAPAAVFCASEMLHDFQKEIIEAAFGAQTFQWYGQVETTANLQECEQHRLHVKEEYGLLELLDDEGRPARPGMLAAAVATGWGNRAFPLLRYNTGDCMVLSSEERCPCGRAGRIIDHIAGRDDDFLITPDGRYVGRLDFVFKAVDTVRESQIVQEDLHTIVIRVAPLPGFTKADEQTVIAKLRERIGSGMNISVETVDGIPRGPSGKFRYVVSKARPELLRAFSPAAP
jgi:phenylacetate-CoA ligase